MNQVRALCPNIHKMRFANRCPPQATFQDPKPQITFESVNPNHVFKTSILTRVANAAALRL